MVNTMVTKSSLLTECRADYLSESRKQRNKFRIDVAPLALKRDGYSCVLCNKYGVNLDVHHIEKWSESPHLRMSLDNVACLCFECHKVAHDGRTTGPVNKLIAEKLKQIVKVCRANGHLNPLKRVVESILNAERESDLGHVDILMLPFKEMVESTGGQIAAADLLRVDQTQISRWSSAGAMLSKDGTVFVPSSAKYVKAGDQSSNALD